MVHPDEWKQIALWLMDCECATAYDALTIKHVSKYEKRRHVSICSNLVKMLQDGRFSGHRPSERENVERRLRRLTELKEYADNCRTKS